MSSIPLHTWLTSGHGQACKQEEVLDGTTGPLTQTAQVPGPAGAAEPVCLLLYPRPEMILLTEPPEPHCAGADMIQAVMINNSSS